MVNCSNGKGNCRSFKVVGSGIGFKGGRYVAENRNIAANRAGSQLFQKIHTNTNFKRFASKTSIKFILMETSQGVVSPKKSTAYEVVKEKLKTPREFIKGDKTIVVNFKYTVQKLTNQDDPEIKKFN
jgi:hypothetical protein